MRDFIGDIHGQADKLLALLSHLGYQKLHGVWCHPERKAMFVGDLIDRGPGQLAVLNIVRPMVEEGAAEAILGNHEFNGIAFHTFDERLGRHLRERNSKNRQQHAAFLAEVGEDSPEHRRWIQWFMQLPLWVETPEFRMVHACWDNDMMMAISPQLGDNCTLTPSLMRLASLKGSLEYACVENIVKGLEVDLPPSVTFTDKDGHPRHRTRVRWWDPAATTYRQAALMGEQERLQLPDTPLPATAQLVYDNKKPVFFGHYWFTGQPQVLSPKICCLDYSAARDEHPLVAYTWEGEQELRSDHLVAVGGRLTPRPAQRPSWSRR